MTAVFHRFFAGLLRSLTVAAAVAGLAVACSGADAPGAPVGADDGPYDYVPPGKADDYRSTTGREYALIALDSITLPNADLSLTGDERARRAEELVKLRFKAISFFVYAYLGSKSHDDANYAYGGFRTTVRQQTFETLEISERVGEPGTYDFLFEAEVAGPKDLLKKLPLTGNTFQLQMPALTTAELESGSYSSQYKNFDPSKLDPTKLTALEMEIEAKPGEPDAYPDYLSWFDDGVLDIAIHIGGDYNAQRYDLLTAKDVFARLVSDLKLTPPVASFEELRIDSGAFVGTLDANGIPVKLEVTLVHPDMAKEEGVGYEGLLQSYRDSASKRDIVIYDGHAGYDSSYSGIVVHYNPRHAIAADDFDQLDLPEKYQLFFFNGCKTYTSYADAMYQHPQKSAKNLDVITTVNFSWLSEMTRVTTDFLRQVTQQSQQSHAPQSYDVVLAELNKGRSWDVIYGVHGLSDNPRVSPYADLATLCSSCGANSDCPGVDNLCLKLSPSTAVCGVACTDDSGCPDGYACRDAAASGSGVISARQCLPKSQSCG